MPESQRKILPTDILSPAEYDQQRKALKANLIPMKKQRRVEVGPFATFYFENYATMWLQVQEMLRIEKGGEAQMADEIAAYDPMIPKGSELTMTMLFEVEDAGRRDAFLRTIGGIEDHISLQVGGHVIKARPEGDVERTRESDGKASAVHFFHFDFPAEAIAAWKGGEGSAMLVIDHPNYGHAALIGAPTRDFLSRECF